MGQVTLCGNCVSGATVLSNRFIDLYMGNANDAQIKIYLYLLRCIGDNKPVSVSDLADFFNYPEKDVLRALKYWEKQNLLKLDFDENKQLSQIRLLPIGGNFGLDNSNTKDTLVITPKDEEKMEAKVFKLPAKPNYSPERLLEFKTRPDIEQLLFIAEQYMKKMLNSNEIASFLYMYDSLGFDADLMEYLVEYCVNNKKKSIHYIETVANSWAIAGIKYVDEAKEYTSNVPGEIYEVFKAFGIQTNRTPVESELAYIRRWLAFGFTTELIVEACERTIMATHNPSFEYADKILSNWNKSNVRSLSDVKKLDELHGRQRQGEKKDPVVSVKPKNGGNKFGDFKQRTYDYDKLEQEAFS